MAHSTEQPKSTHFFSGLADTVLAGYVSASMFIYGAVKFAQFEGVEVYGEKLVSELTGMELMWTFYGYSLTYPIIVGVFEILGAVLLFMRKTRLIGAFLLTGILVNIIIQDVIYGVLSGAIVSASIYQLIIIYFMVKHRAEVKKGIEVISKIKGPSRTIAQRIVHIAIAVLVAIMIKMTIGL